MVQMDSNPSVSREMSAASQPPILRPLSNTQRLFLTQFGERVKGLRLLRGWTRDDLAKRASISVPYLGCVEHGQRDLSVGYALRLAKAFDVPVRLLLGMPADPLTKNGLAMARLIDKTDPQIAALILKFLRLVREAVVQARRHVGQPEAARTRGRKRKVA